MRNNPKDDPRVIYKIHANNTFVSVVGPDDNYDGVVLEFVEFDKQTNKKKAEIDCYYTIPGFLSLCQMIVDKSVISSIKYDKQRCQQINLKYSDANLFDKRGGGMVDGAVKYRHSFFCSASKDNINGLFVAEQCDGVKDAKGLINPVSNWTNKTKIMVPFQFSDLFEMALISQCRIQAFITAKTIRGDYYRTNVTQFPTQQAQPQQVVQQAVQPVAPTQQVAQPQQMVQPQPVQSVMGASSPEEAFKATGTDGYIDPDRAFYEQYAAQYSN